MIRLTTIFSLALLFATPALAQTPKPPVPVDMTTVLTDLKGAPIPDGSQAATNAECKQDFQKCPPLTLGTVIASALLMDRKDEPNLSTIDKAKRGYLAKEVLDNKAVVLSPAQVTEIEKLLSVWSPLIINDALPLIDPTVKLAD